MVFCDYKIIVVLMLLRVLSVFLHIEIQKFCPNINPNINNTYCILINEKIAESSGLDLLLLAEIKQKRIQLRMSDYKEKGRWTNP